MITKTLAFKNNIEFVKLLNDGGMEVSDDRRKQIMDVTFQSFIEQNGIKASSEVNSKKKQVLKMMHLELKEVCQKEVCQLRR